MERCLSPAAAARLLVTVALRPEARAALRAVRTARRLRGHGVPLWYAPLQRTCVWVVRSGVGPHRARVALERALAAVPEPAAVIDAGCAGGLVGELHAGSPVVPERVVGSDGRAWAAANPWRERLAAAARSAGRPCTGGVLLASATALLTPEEKADAARRYGAVAVSMETGAVAALCAEREIPFAALRVILDPVDADFEVAHSPLVGRDGRPRPGAMAAHPLRTAFLARTMGRVQKVMAEVLRAAFD